MTAATSPPQLNDTEPGHLHSAHTSHMWHASGGAEN